MKTDNQKIMFYSIYINCAVKANHRTESRLVIAWGWKWEQALTIKVHGGFSGKMEM